jgi:putative hydrolase of the HAD superfamily
MTENGLNEAEVYEIIFKSGLEEKYDRGEISTKAFLNAIEKNLGISATSEEIAAAWSDIFWPNKAVIKIIPKLREASYRLILASNTNELHYEWFCGQFDEVLKHFDHLMLSHKLGIRKPDIEFYKRCVKVSGCQASQCIYIDDREDLVNVANRFGMQSILYTPKVDLAHNLRIRGVNV